LTHYDRGGSAATGMKTRC